MIDQYTIPKVSYEMEVTYLYHAEYNPYGVGLGDVVQCVDLAFGDTPLRLEARIVAMTVDRLDRSRSTITVSNALGERSLAASVAGLGDWVNEIAVVSGGTAEYIAHILDNLNAEINATGGFVYITDGQGLITYDKSVSNPLVGAEADQATEMKGGTLRFANKKTAQGEWDWTNVITADGYIALAATIARITSGFIGSASGGNYWNLDTGEIRLSTATGIGDSGTIQDLIDGVNATITSVDVEYAQGTSATNAPTTGWSTNPPTWEQGKYIWSRTATTTGTGTAARTTYSTPVMISGSDGRSGTGITTIREQYYLSTSNETQTGGTWSYEQPEWTKGTYIWTRSVITWDTTPPSITTTDPVLAKALTQANSAIAALDDSLNQEGIYNRLTNYGQWQGIYTDPTTGRYYFNAEYIHAGTMSAERIKGGSLRLGGSSNVNGVLQVFDANSTEICRLDNNGANITGELTTLLEYNRFNPTSSSYDRAVDSRIGIMQLNDTTWMSYVAGEGGSGDELQLGGLRITGRYSRNDSSAFGFIQVTPPLASQYGRSSIFSDRPIVICSTSENASHEAGIFLGSNGVRVTGKNGSPTVRILDGSKLEVHASDIDFIGTGTSDSMDINLDLNARNVTIRTLTVSTWLTVNGTKSRLVTTDDYSDRLLYCYETTEPLFGDVGSATIGDDGVCIVSIDSIFTECARTDMKYQVLLQKCSKGDLWVSKKTPTYFVVEGTPMLPFDWEVKAHQTGYEFEHIDNAEDAKNMSQIGDMDTTVLNCYETDSELDESYNPIELSYLDELMYVNKLESLY